MHGLFAGWFNCILCACFANNSFSSFIGRISVFSVLLYRFIVCALAMILLLFYFILFYFNVYGVFFSLLSAECVFAIGLLTSKLVNGIQWKMHNLKISFNNIIRTMPMHIPKTIQNIRTLFLFLISRPVYYRKHITYVFALLLGLRALQRSAFSLSSSHRRDLARARDCDVPL